MHNNIMAAGSKDRSPMLGPGRYSQWRSRFLWYINTKPNSGGLKKSILSGPYVPATVQVQAVEAAEGRPAVPQHDISETIFEHDLLKQKNTFSLKRKAIFLLLTGIRDEINSTVDSLQQANEIGYPLKGYNRLRASTPRHKAKNAKLITPSIESVSVSDEDSDPKQAQRDKEMHRNLALLAKYFKKLYKPTNNNLRTSSNSRNKTEDTTPRYNNDNQSRQFGNQRTIHCGARKTVASE
ncbi:hypothetical protein Tco_0584405 [Tanacetum coccineum]